MVVTPPRASRVARGSRRRREVRPAVGRGRVSGGDRLLLGNDARADLVEARTAINGTIIARRERHSRLAAAFTAYGGVVFPRSSTQARTLGRGSTRWTPLGVVLETLAGKEGLLAAREDELLAAITAGQYAVLVHPLLEPPREDAVTSRRPPGSPAHDDMEGRIRGESSHR